MRMCYGFKLAAAAGILLGGLISAGCEPRKAESLPPRDQTPEVVVVTIKPKPVVLTSELPGRTASYMLAEIRPQVNGLIKKRLFKEGSDVKAGQVLYQIDPAPFQAVCDSAAANLAASEKAADRARAALETSFAEVTQQQSVLALARKTCRRYEDLFQDRAVSATQRDRAVTDADVAEAGLRAAKARVKSARQALAAAEATIQQAKAALETARINLSYTRITAPISGRIGRSTVTEGAIVTAYQPMALAVIQQLDPIYVDVPQASTEMLRLNRSLKNGRLCSNGEDGRDVMLFLEDGTPYPQEGTLQFRDVTVDSTTGSVTLRIVFPNPEHILLPNMFVRAVVQEGIAEQAILVPQQGVTRDPKGNPVALVLDAAGKVAPRRLTLDRAMNDKWLVSEGLSSGDRLIVEGMQKVRPGATARAVPFENIKTGPASEKAGDPRAD